MLNWFELHFQGLGPYQFPYYLITSCETDTYRKILLASGGFIGKSPKICGCSVVNAHSCLCKVLRANELVL